MIEISFSRHTFLTTSLLTMELLIVKKILKKILNKYFLDSDGYWQLDTHKAMISELCLEDSNTLLILFKPK